MSDNLDLTGKQALYLANKKLADSLDGVGALKGAPCEKESSEAIPGGVKLNWKWEDKNGVVHRGNDIIYHGQKGDTGNTGPKGEKGDTGDSLKIEKTYASIEDMKDDSTPVDDGYIVAVYLDTKTPIYLRDSTYTPATEQEDIGYDGYKFIAYLSDIAGLKGEKGDKGDTGAQGAPGERGTDGISPAVELISTLGGHEQHIQIENLGSVTAVSGDIMPNKTFTGTEISTSQIGTTGVYRDVIIAIDNSKVGDYYRNKNNHQVFLRTDKNGVANTWEYQYNAKGITGYEEYKEFVDPDATYDEYAQYMRGQNFNPKIVWTKPNLFDVDTDLYRIYNYKIDSTQGAGDAWCHEGVFSDTADVPIGKYSVFEGSFYLTFTTTEVVPALTQSGVNEYTLIYNEQTSKAQIHVTPLDASQPSTLGGEMTVEKTKDKPADSTLYDMTLRGMGIWVEIWWEGTSKDTARECKKESTTGASDISSIKTDVVGTTMVITRESGIETEVDMYSDKVMPKIRADRAKRDLIKLDDMLKVRWFEVYDTTDNVSLIHRGDNNSYMEYRGGKIDTTVAMPPFDTYKYQVEDSYLLDASDTLIDTIAWSQHEFAQEVTTDTSLPPNEGYYMTHSLRGGTGATTVEYLPGFEADFSTGWEKQVAFNLMQDGKPVATYDIGFNGVTMDLTHAKVPYDSWKGAPYYFGTKNVYQWDAAKDMWVIVLDNWLYSASADDTPLWMGGYSIGMYLNSTNNKYELKITQDASSAEAYRTLVDSEGVLDPSGNEIVLTGGQSLTLCNNIADATTMTYSIHEKYTGRTLTCVAVRYGSKFFILSTSENVDYTAHHTVTTQERCAMIPYITMSGTMTFYDKTLSKTILWDGSACIEFLQGETDTFPTSPISSQEYSSNSTKAKYAWDNTNKYWELKDGLLMQLFNASNPIGKIAFGAMPTLGTWSSYDFGGVVYVDSELNDGKVMEARLPNATGVVSVGPDKDTSGSNYGRGVRILGNKGAFYKGSEAERVVPRTMSGIRSTYDSDTTTDSVIKFDAMHSQYYNTSTNSWQDVAGAGVYTNEEIVCGYSVAVKGKNVRAWIRTA